MGMKEEIGDHLSLQGPNAFVILQGNRKKHTYMSPPLVLLTELLNPYNFLNDEKTKEHLLF